MKAHEIYSIQQANRRDQLLREQNALLAGQPAPRPGFFQRLIGGVRRSKKRPPTMMPVSYQATAPAAVMTPEQYAWLLNARVAELERRVQELEQRQ